MTEMKKLLLILVAISIGVAAFGQSTVKDAPGTQWTQKDTLTLGYLQRISQHTAPCYKLYPTENMWTFLELETFSGRIWQVQYSVKGPDYRFKTILNGDSMIPFLDSEGEFAGRFELYKTQNMYNFILLDTATGSTWQVQWSTDAKDRAVLRIW